MILTKKKMNKEKNRENANINGILSKIVAAVKLCPVKPRDRQLGVKQCKKSLHLITSSW